MWQYHCVVKAPFAKSNITMHEHRVQGHLHLQGLTEGDDYITLQLCIKSARYECFCTLWSLILVV